MSYMLGIKFIIYVQYTKLGKNTNEPMSMVPRVVVAIVISVKNNTDISSLLEYLCYKYIYSF